VGGEWGVEGRVWEDNNLWHGILNNKASDNKTFHCSFSYAFITNVLIENFYEKKGSYYI
jgi:hypothetical protein